jgi:O6-methylguanine-DNA--protein-cysteine methyltransferase
MIEFDHDDEVRDVARLLTRAPARSTAPPPPIADAAAAAGLLDVAYAMLDSPVGRLLVARTPVGLARIAYIDGDLEESVLSELASRISPRLLAAPRQLDDPRRELDQYFHGLRRSFEIPLDLRLMTDFARRVLTATAAIPYGSVSTYREVATRPGARAARGRPATRSAPTRCRSSCPAIASSTAAAGSAAIPAAWTASACCWG